MKAVLTLGLFLASLNLARAQPLQLHTRSRVNSPVSTNEWEAVEKTITWDPKKTAIIICDMWDKHWCKGATERVAEMAPIMNEAVAKARQQGVLIIHAPSETMGAYKDTPQRMRAEQAPAVTPPAAIEGWKKLNKEKEGPLPIDDSDGGCDDLPQCSSKPPYPWKREIAALEIAPEDAVSDKGAEVYNLLQQHGID